MQKIRYELDPHNRLIAKTGKETELGYFRKVFDGRFKIGKDNELIYHIKAPASGDTPHQVKFKGTWALNENHDLEFTLDKWKRETSGDKLVIKGGIIDADKNSLVFSIGTKTGCGGDSLYLVKFEGSWQADGYNRLSFRMERERSGYDTLTLKGAWEINKSHEIIYQYEKTDLARRLKKTHTLIFKGFWDIKDKARISYVMDRSTDSVFNFRTGLGIFKDKYIKYEIGIGAEGRIRPVKKALILYGTWNFRKGEGLIFEIEYADKKFYSINFGGEAKLTDRDTVSFKLRNNLNDRDIGVDLELKRNILKGDGEAFLRLLKSKEESAVFFGIGRRW